MLPPFAKYGLKELFIFSLVWIAIGALLWFVHPAARPVVLLPAAGLLFTLNFFRDPRREVPSEAGLVVSPADGTVVEISECEESEFLKRPCAKIGIFLSVFDVHVNRSPCDGPVTASAYRPGRFLDARHPDCGPQNERQSIQVGPMVVKQIAGLIARRIVCEAKPGDVLKRGERFGMIKFGSRTELYIPKDQVEEIRVRLKDKVKGGETVIARTR
ncbi:MAG TPA: phosphatidylserine decarboxylase family protein [Planctomycetota bacterium]